MSNTTKSLLYNALKVHFGFDKFKGNQEAFLAMMKGHATRMADVDFSLLAFCGKIRPHVKVALSGECADEIFGGYPWYRDPEVRDQNGFPWAQNTLERSAFLLDWGTMSFLNSHRPDILI